MIKAKQLAEFCDFIEIKANGITGNMKEIAAELRRLAPMEARVKELEDALRDARSGMRYIREMHGDLYGVEFDRVEQKATKALGETK